MPVRLDLETTKAITEKILKPSAPDGFYPFIATKSDIDEMYALALDSFKDEASPSDMYDYYLKRGHALIYGLKRDGHIAGYSVIEFNLRQKRVYAVELVTAENWRGRGIGLWLLSKTNEIAALLGYRHIASHVKPDDIPAIGMNKKAGMQIVKTIEDYYSDGGPALYMRKTLIS